MLCDIHIERKKEIGCSSFLLPVLHSDYRKLLNNDWTPWGVTICVFVHQVYSLLRILCCRLWVSDTCIMLYSLYKCIIWTQWAYIGKGWLDSSSPKVTAPTACESCCVICPIIELIIVIIMDCSIPLLCENVIANMSKLRYYSKGKILGRINSF